MRTITSPIARKSRTSRLEPRSSRPLLHKDSFTSTEQISALGSLLYPSISFKAFQSKPQTANYWLKKSGTFCGTFIISLKAFFNNFPALGRFSMQSGLIDQFLGIWKNTASGCALMSNYYYYAANYNVGFRPKTARKCIFLVSQANRPGIKWMTIFL